MSVGAVVDVCYAFAVQPLKSLVRGITAHHDHLYSRVAGAHPHRRPWHPQWLSVKDLYRDLREILPTLEGEVLDVGCLGKPYAAWLTRATSHIGIDVVDGPMIDYVTREGEPWPLESERFQSAVCTQTLEVAKDVPHLVDELSRVLRPTGTAVISTPFCYNDLNGCDGDSGVSVYWRHSVRGVEELMAQRFDIVEVRTHGAVGSTVGILLLNCVHQSLARHPLGRLLVVLLLPVRLPLCFGANMLACVLDRLDRTGNFYHNVLLVVRKKAVATTSDVR